MTSNLPATLPSLARAFEGEREALRLALKEGDMSAAQVVTEARRALDRTGTLFASQTQDVQVHKAGLWLVEMVKAGAAVLDSGASAEIIWREVPTLPKREIAGSTLFYGAAGVLGVAGLMQGTGLVVITAVVLTGLRFFDPKDWKRLLTKIPFIGRKKPLAISGPDGTAVLADARVTVESAGFVDGLADALRTADHILMRMAEPMPESHWTDEPKLISLMQGLLEAQTVGDGDFALRLIETELGTVLRSEGIEAVDYKKSEARLFDVLPGLGMKSGEIKMAAPALLSGDQVLRRGTVWKGEDGQ